MTFEGVTAYFSQDKRCLLDETQIYLYLDVTLENFTLVCMLGKALTPNPILLARLCLSPFPQGLLCPSHTWPMGTTFLNSLVMCCGYCV